MGPSQVEAIIAPMQGMYGRRAKGCRVEARFGSRSHLDCIVGVQWVSTDYYSVHFFHVITGQFSWSSHWPSCAVTLVFSWGSRYTYLVPVLMVYSDIPNQDSIQTKVEQPKPTSLSFIIHEQTP